MRCYAGRALAEEIKVDDRKCGNGRHRYRSLIEILWYEEYKRGHFIYGELRSRWREGSKPCATENLIGSHGRTSDKSDRKFE